MLPKSPMAYIEVFYGWPNASTLSAQIKTRERRKLGKVKKADRAPRPCLAVEWLKSIAQLKECFGQG